MSLKLPNVIFPLLVYLISLLFIVNGQEEGKDTIPSLEILVSPKIPVKKCSDESQEVNCRLNDIDDRLKKQMLEAQQLSGYGGYIEFLLIRRGRTGKELIVQETHVADIQKLGETVPFPLDNLTTADDGQYFCKVVWHSYTRDKFWTSGVFKLNVYDCIDLTTETQHVSVQESVTLNCIDVDVPMRWFKDGEDLDEDRSKLLNATNRDRRHYRLTRVEANSSVTTLVSRAKRQNRVASVTTAKPTTSAPVRYGVRQITVGSEEDAGVYSCKATFEDTQQIFTKETVVSIKTPPTAPTNIRTPKRSPNSIILRWEMKPVNNQYVHAEPTFFTIYYRPIEGGNLLSKTVLKIPEVMLTNLKANTVYFVRIQAENELGTSPSASRIVVTPAANEMVEVDRRLIEIVNLHIRVLEQDLGSISSVLKEIVASDDNKKETELTTVKP